MPDSDYAWFKLAAVILAAGQSTRMGRPKLLLPWGGNSVLAHHLQTWKSLGARQIAVVCRPDDSALALELDRLRLHQDQRIPNPSASEGMFSSILAATRWDGWAGSISHWAVVLGDQPQVRLETLKALLSACATNPTQPHQPSRNREPRHPVILPGSSFRALAIAGDSVATFKEFLSSQSPVLVELDDPGLDLDIDTPADYRRALDTAGLP